MNNLGNSPEKSQADFIPTHDPIHLKRIKFSLLPEKIKNKLKHLNEEAETYDRWFNHLSDEDQFKEYQNFFLDGDGQVILRTKTQLVEDKAHRMRYVRVIEKLKREGKLDKGYQLK